MVDTNKQKTSASQMIDQEEIFQTNIPRKEENAIYVEYDPDVALTKLQHIQTLIETERYIYTSHLSELLPIIGIKVTPHLSEILKKLAQDNDKIKRTLLSQIPHVINFLQTFEDGYDLIKDIAIHPIFDMLANPTLDIKEEAGVRLSEAAKLLTNEDQQNIVLKKILDMAHDQHSEENRIVSVQLLSKMAEIFGRELCTQFVGFEFLSLGDDPQQRVLKEVVVNLPYISKIVSPKFYKDNLLEFYEKQTKDNSWNIRKAAVEIIVSMSEISDNDMRQNTLSLILIKSLEDANKWVRVAAYKQLGAFINTLYNLKRSERLFMHYMRMIDPSINQLGLDNEIMISCAFNFPAVLRTYGKDKWNELSQLLKKLITSKNKRVKLPIACGLHDIAKIIGPEKAEKDLFEVYELILKDPSDSIKLGVIRSLSEFLKVFDKERRENLLELVLSVQKEQKKWRIRQCIANQLDQLTEIYTDQETVFQYLFPISFKLCNDTVSSVREMAAKKVYALLNALWDHEMFGQCVIQNINAFAQQIRYNQRQTFVQMCQKLIKFPDLFKTHFLENFVSLADDKITNIAQVLGKIVYKKNKLGEEQVIKDMIEKIQNDDDEDVRQMFEDVINKYKNKIQDETKKQTKKQSISQYKLLMDKEELKKLQEQKKQKQEEKAKEVQKELIVIPQEQIENHSPTKLNEEYKADDSPEKGQEAAQSQEQSVQAEKTEQPSESQEKEEKQEAQEQQGEKQNQQDEAQEKKEEIQENTQKGGEEVKEESPEKQEAREEQQELKEESREKQGEEVKEDQTEKTEEKEEEAQTKEEQTEGQVQQEENQQEEEQVQNEEPEQVQNQEEGNVNENIENQDIKPDTEEESSDVKPQSEPQAEEEKVDNQDPPEEEKTEAEEQKTEN